MSSQHKYIFTALWCLGCILAGYLFDCWMCRRNGNCQPGNLEDEE